MTMLMGSLGSSALGAVGSYFGGQDQAKAAGNALQLQQQMWQQNSANLNPWIQTGQGADYTLASLYGLNGQKPNYSSFYNSPDYNFAFQQGNQATTNLLAAKGNLLSGGGLAALTKFGQGLASQQYQNYVGRLMGISGQGEQAAASLAQDSNQASNGMANSLYGQGTANASGLMGIANSLGGGVNSFGNMALLNRVLNGNNTSAYGNPSYGGGNMLTGDAYGGSSSNPLQGLGPEDYGAGY